VSPAPETYHQRVSKRILIQLFRQIDEVGLGEVFDAPIDVELSRTDIVEPDLLVILAPNLGIIGKRKIDGIPDLVVEITTDWTRAVDREKKRELYRRVGVPEYWLVETAERVVERHVLRGGRYELAGKHADAVPFGGLPGVTVDLRKVW